MFLVVYRMLQDAYFKRQSRKEAENLMSLKKKEWVGPAKSKVEVGDIEQLRRYQALWGTISGPRLDDYQIESNRKNIDFIVELKTEVVRIINSFIGNPNEGTLRSQAMKDLFNTLTVEGAKIGTLTVPPQIRSSDKFNRFLKDMIQYFANVRDAERWNE